MNTAENRAKIIASELAGTGQIMTQAIAWGFLQFHVMPDGVAKTHIMYVAKVVQNTWEDMDMSIPSALGCAFLMKTSDPIMFESIAKEAEEADSAAQ